jgi:hypothetical protein
MYLFGVGPPGRQTWKRPNPDTRSRFTEAEVTAIQFVSELLRHAARATDEHRRLIIVRPAAAVTAGARNCTPRSTRKGTKKTVAGRGRRRGGKK